jgi:hypothetical protein
MRLKRSFARLLLLAPVIGLAACAHQASPLPIAFPAEAPLPPSPAQEFAARSLSPVVPATLKDQAHRYILGQLKNPIGAKFKHDFVTSGKRSLAVCGLVAEQRVASVYGAYRPYYVESIGGIVTGGAVGPFGTDVRFATVCGNGDSPDPAHFAF